MAINKGEKKLKGIYLVPDPLMMKPHFGPSEHIKVGLQELKKYFDIHLLILGGHDFSGEIQKPDRSLTKGVATKNGFAGLLRDLKLLFTSNRNIRSLVRQLKNQDIDFIYERGQYLNLKGVKAAKRLGISHYYEVNWLNFLGIRQFYESWFNHIARRIEEWSYRQSTLNFFVGTQHKLIDIPEKKVHTIQNGIDEELLDRNKEHRNSVNGKIRICYVANLMPHHRFDVFIEALKIAGVEEQLELHMVGYNFEEFEAMLPRGLVHFLHGPKKKDELPAIMRACNIGLISGGPSYSSFMKLFEYAAFRMCVICPDLENIRLMFDEDEIVFFETDNAASLAAQLQDLCRHPDHIGQYGDKIYKKVKDRYTWEKIYKDVSDQIINGMKV